MAVAEPCGRGDRARPWPRRPARPVLCGSPEGQALPAHRPQPLGAHGGHRLTREGSGVTPARSLARCAPAASALLPAVLGETPGPPPVPALCRAPLPPVVQNLAATAPGDRVQPLAHPRPPVYPHFPPTARGPSSATSVCHCCVHLHHVRPQTDAPPSVPSLSRPGPPEPVGCACGGRLTTHSPTLSVCRAPFHPPPAHGFLVCRRLRGLGLSR